VNALNGPDKVNVKQNYLLPECNRFPKTIYLKILGPPRLFCVAIPIRIMEVEIMNVNKIEIYV